MEDQRPVVVVLQIFLDGANHSLATTEQSATVEGKGVVSPPLQPERIKAADVAVSCPVDRFAQGLEHYPAELVEIMRRELKQVAEGKLPKLRDQGIDGRVPFRPRGATKDKDVVEVANIPSNSSQNFLVRRGGRVLSKIFG